MEPTRDLRRMGRIVRTARKNRGWTQHVLGERCRLSASTISRLESGKQPLRDVLLLRCLAEVLELPVSTFGLAELHPSVAAGPLPKAHRVVAVRTEVQEAEPVLRRELLSGLAGLVGTSVLPGPPATDGEPCPRDIRTGFLRAQRHYAACEYRAVAALLPTLIAEGQRVIASGRARDEAHFVMADLYNLGAILAGKLADYPLSWVMADRARTHAEAGGNVAAIAVSVRETAVAMRRAGHHQEAATLLTDTADRLPTDTIPHLTGRGSLLITAANGAARRGETATALGLLAEAGDVARHLPAHIPAGTTFTRSQMPLYRIAIYNALGQFGRSLTIARTIPPASIGTVERRTRLYTDVARAWYGFGDRARCLDALEQVERLAAEDVRRPSVHELTSRMLNRPGSVSPRLVAFAKRNGLAA